LELSHNNDGLKYLEFYSKVIGVSVLQVSACHG
jgi:hypothetical protein